MDSRNDPELILEFLKQAALTCLSILEKSAPSAEASEAQSDPVRVFVSVPQANVSSVKPGTNATITVDEFPGQTFAGKVARDAGEFDQASRTLLLEIDVPNPAARLFAGMHAHGTFALKNPTLALPVPNNSILIDSKWSSSLNRRAIR